MKVIHLNSSDYNKECGSDEANKQIRGVEFLEPYICLPEKRNFHSQQTTKMKNYREL